MKVLASGHCIVTVWDQFKLQYYYSKRLNCRISCAILHTKNDIRISRDPIRDLENVESLEFFIVITIMASESGCNLEGYN